MQGNLTALHPQIAAVCVGCSMRLLKSSHIWKQKNHRCNQVQRGARHLYSLTENKAGYNIFCGISVAEIHHSQKQSGK